MPSLAGPPFGAEAAGSGYPGPLDLRRPMRTVPGPLFTDFGVRTRRRLPAKLLPAAAATTAAPSTASTAAPVPPARLPLCAPLPPPTTATTTSIIFLTDRPV
uniref:DMRT like family B with proline rich C-terminal 1 n=1 Tax=Gorilla gorilla gorilla TaxID=9595 RepID=A0A2I2Z6X0_GORGO